MKVYKNGAYEKQRDISFLGSNPVTKTDTLNFGVASGSPYSGSLDDIAIYNFVWSQMIFKAVVRQVLG